MEILAVAEVAPPTRQEVEKAVLRASNAMVRMSRLEQGRAVGNFFQFSDKRRAEALAEYQARRGAVEPTELELATIEYELASDACTSLEDRLPLSEDWEEYRDC